MAHPLLSININKYALLRNSRGRDVPNLLWAADTCLAAGAHGITVHPRSDERHVRLDDVPVLAEHLIAHHPQIELNVECACTDALVELVLQTRPAQCTLVPVTPGEVTSDHGWTFPASAERLRRAAMRLRDAGIRVSAFMDCDVPEAFAALADTGVQRAELYTGPYAWAWGTENQEAQRSLVFGAAEAAVRVGLELNAGHDLDRFNLEGLRGLPGLCEVSIGHAQICRALEVGTAQSVGELRSALGWT